MKKIILILILSFMMISSAFAVDSSNWTNVTVSNHEFKLPPKYNGGSLNDNSYQIENWNNFAILCIDTYIASNYGYMAENYDYQDMTINGHPARYFCGYNTYEKTDLSRIYFPVGNSIYCISWQSSNLSDDVEEMVATSDVSEMSDSDFYARLDKGLEDAKAEEEAEKNTYIPEYRNNNHHHHFFRHHYY